MCEKVACERVVCDKVVCNKVACDRDTCERLCGTKLCVTKSFERDGLTCSVDLAKCHVCHAKRRSLSPSATPTTQNEGRCQQVPHLTHKTKVDASPVSQVPPLPRKVDRQVPRLPRKVPRRHGRPTARKRATASRVSYVPRLPRKT